MIKKRIETRVTVAYGCVLRVRVVYFQKFHAEDPTKIDAKSDLLPAARCALQPLKRNRGVAGATQGLATASNWMQITAAPQV